MGDWRPLPGVEGAPTGLSVNRARWGTRQGLGNCTCPSAPRRAGFHPPGIFTGSRSITSPNRLLMSKVYLVHGILSYSAAMTWIIAKFVVVGNNRFARRKGDPTGNRVFTHVS